MNGLPGLRLLRKSPAPSFLAVASLGLGIGASAALFGWVDSLLLRPLPARDPHELVFLKSVSPERDALAGVSVPDFEDYRAAESALSDLAGYARMPLAVGIGSAGGTERLLGDFVSGSYFRLLGLSLALGRGISPGEDVPEGPAVAVISHALWRRAFGADPDALGSTVRLNGRPFTIAGVAPPGFHGLPAGGWGPADLWVPLARVDEILPPWWREGGSLDRRDSRHLHVIGRIRPEVRIDEAKAALAMQARRLEAAYPETNRGWSVVVRPAGSGRIPAEQRETVLSFTAILGTVVALVLLIACSNVSQLLLLRTSARSREIAVRYALGASRGRLVRQLLGENLVLYGAGCAASTPVAVLGIELFRRLASFSLGAAVLDLRYDGRVIVFTGSLALVLAAGFGTAVALKGSRVPADAALHQRPGVGAEGGRTRGFLVAVQVALAFVLLAGAGLFLRTLWNFYRLDPGFRIDNVLLVSVDFNTSAAEYDEPRARRFYREALERVRSLPSVASAAWGGEVPLGGLQLIIWFTPEEKPPPREEDWIRVSCNIVTPGFLRTMGMELVAGRDFTAADDENAPGAALVNEAMARRHWPDADPVRRRFVVRGRGGVKEVEIVGVVRDAKHRGLALEPEPYIYFPLAQRHFPQMTVHLRFEGRVAPVLAGVRERLAELEPDLPLFEARTLEEQLAGALAPQRLGALLLGISAALALLLAAIGVYAVTAYSVVRRTPEIGIRGAVGADRGDLTRLVVLESLRPTSLGLAAGVGGALALSRFVEGFLFEVTGMDFPTYSASVLILAAVALAGAYFPGRRAAEIDPLAAIRFE